jgi:hypothetical protein
MFYFSVEECHQTCQAKLTMPAAAPKVLPPQSQPAFRGNANLPIGAFQAANREIGVPRLAPSKLRIGIPANSNLGKVLAQRADDFFPAAVHDIFAKLLEGDVHDVVVVEFLGRDLAAEFEPDAVKQIDFLGGQPRSVRTEIENFFLAVRRVNFQS